jgi:uncharacterized protein (DUF983 family)
MGIDKQNSTHGYVYSCPFCGVQYLHDGAYLHSVGQCQKVEREKQQLKNDAH